MEEKEHRKHLSKFKKPELIQFIINDQNNVQKTLKHHMDKNKRLGQEIRELNNIIAANKNIVSEDGNIVSGIWEKKYIKCLNKNDKLKSEINNQKAEIARLHDNKRLEILRKELERYKLKWDLQNLGLNKKQFLFIVYKRLKDQDKTYTCSGYVKKESLNHVKILIHAKGTNDRFSYIINKESIIDIKEYYDSPENYISYDELEKLDKK